MQPVGARVFVAKTLSSADIPTSSGPVVKIPKACRADPVLPPPLADTGLTKEEKNLLPQYVSPRAPGVAQVTVEAQEFLEEPTIPEGVPQSLDTITPKL